MSTIAVTGANSYLGRAAIKFLREKTPHQILALVSPRAELSPHVDARVRFLRADLTQPLPVEAAELAKVSRLFHFAWTRTGSAEQVRQENCAMIERLLDAMPDASKFWFVSSVSASPKPMSVYGATKYEATQLVRARGGSVLVCGLVVEPEPPRGPYGMLRNTVGRLPLRLRLTRGEPLVFPLRLADLGGALAHVADSDLSPNIYRMFSPPVGFNVFLALLEELAPKGRVSVALPTPLILHAAALAKQSRFVPQKLCDQILTFLYKDADHLLGCSEMPGLAWKRCDDTSFFE